LLLETRPRLGHIDIGRRLASLGYRDVAEMDGNTLRSAQPS
jgi:hypothetical protein